MDGRKTQEARERASARFKSKKPKRIFLTQEQMVVVTVSLEADNSRLITQQEWERLRPALDMNRMTFARRATVTGFNVRIGFDWDEYEWGVHSTKALVQIRCVHCAGVHVILAKKLFARRHTVQACPKCYSSLYLYDAKWRAKNSASQLVAQNRPAVLEKHRENSRAMWVGDQGKVMRDAQQRMVSDPTYRANMARIMRDKWASDVDYRDRVNGKGVYKHTGLHEGVTTYHSKLELAFLLWCADNGKQVVRCELHIPYVDPDDGREHDYYPDFVVEGAIVEVKGQRWIDAAPATYRAKIDALAQFCDANRLSYRVVLDRDLKAYSKRATAYHEAQKQGNHPVQG
jgi:hypothetical protein